MVQMQRYPDDSILATKYRWYSTVPGTNRGVGHHVNEP